MEVDKLTVDEFGYYHKGNEIVGVNGMCILVDDEMGVLHGWGDEMNSGIKEKYMRWYTAYMKQGFAREAESLKLINLSEKFNGEDTCTLLNYFINVTGGYGTFKGLSEEESQERLKLLRELGY